MEPALLYCGRQSIGRAYLYPKNQEASNNELDSKHDKEGYRKDYPKHRIFSPEMITISCRQSQFWIQITLSTVTVFNNLLSYFDNSQHSSFTIMHVTYTLLVKSNKAINMYHYLSMGSHLNFIHLIKWHFEKIFSSIVSSTQIFINVILHN